MSAAASTIPRRRPPARGLCSRVLAALWDPRLLASAALLLVLMAGAWFLYDWARSPATLPIESVRFEGEFRYLPVARLKQAVDEVAMGGFFNVDVRVVQGVVESLPWVRHANVRRVWPDALRISVIEHQPVARWGSDGLINSYGELFRPQPGTFPQGLPVLDAPMPLLPGVVRQYRNIQLALAPIGRSVASLSQDSRRAWWLRLDDGLKVRLGRTEPYPRLLRFIRMYPRLVAEGPRPVYADLRYVNGFALKREPEPVPEPGQES